MAVPFIKKALIKRKEEILTKIRAYADLSEKLVSDEFLGILTDVELVLLEDAIRLKVRDYDSIRYRLEEAIGSA